METTVFQSSTFFLFETYCFPGGSIFLSSDPHTFNALVPCDDDSENVPTITLESEYVWVQTPGPCQTQVLSHEQIGVSLPTWIFEFKNEETHQCKNFLLRRSPLCFGIQGDTLPFPAYHHHAKKNVSCLPRVVLGHKSLLIYLK